MVNPTLISDRVLVKNPAYGTPIGEWGSRSVKPEPFLIKSLEEKNKFFTRLEASIMEEGIRNPIFCNSYSHGTYCRYGTCRLWIARKNNLDIPMIIADYARNWDDLQELYNELDIMNKYQDQPQIIEIGIDEMRIDACPHYHLDEANG